MVDGFSILGIVILGFVFFGKNISGSDTIATISHDVFGVEFASAEGGAGCCGCGCIDFPPNTEADQDIELN